MKNTGPWQLVLRPYRRSPDGAQKKRYSVWIAAIGLQGVDSLSPSDYFIRLVQKHIEGKLTFSQVEKKLSFYYRWHSHSPDISEETWEADLVSCHIAQLLSETDFEFSPRELLNIHHKLFKDVYDFAGDFRNYDIRKKEWVLNGDSVSYADWETIEKALPRLFKIEQQTSYRDLSARKAIGHLARFISALWLIHPYGEGNTRTTAVFLMRYLKSMGFFFDHEVFLEAWYFRNCLVRANYKNPEKGISRDYHFLEGFLQNLLLGAENPLRNQELHVDFPNIKE